MPSLADPTETGAPHPVGRWRRLVAAAGLVLALLAFDTATAVAQTCDPDDEGCVEPEVYRPPSDDRSREVTDIEWRDRGFLNSRGTDSITAQIDRIRLTCDRMNQNYRIHCLVLEMRQVADSIPASGEFAPVRAALLDASRGLQAITDTYEDPSAPRVRARVGGRPAAPQTPPITAIRPEAVARAAAEAEAVLDEAITVLLRSAENSARRQVAFQPIAQALDSTKVLLRST
jgi:hypothetical protein